MYRIKFKLLGLIQSYSYAWEIIHVPDDQSTGRFKSGIGREENGYALIMRKISKRKRNRKKKMIYWKLWPDVRLHERTHINLRCTRHS